MVTITSPDGKFRTKYMHLKSISIKDGQEINEATQIGEIGGSRKGEEFGGNVHLHYQIEKYDSESKTWNPYNPIEGKEKTKDNVVDPQKWINTNQNSSKSLDPKEVLRNELDTLKKSRAYSPEYVEKRTKEINLELSK